MLAHVQWSRRREQR